MPIALVITTAGINCDLELGHAFALAGAEVESIHLNRLMKDPALLDRFDLIGMPGGFSYGDAVAAGRTGSKLEIFLSMKGKDGTVREEPFVFERVP